MVVLNPVDLRPVSFFVSLQSKEGPGGPPGEMGKPGIPVGDGLQAQLLIALRNSWESVNNLYLYSLFFRGPPANMGSVDDRGSQERW